MSKKYQERLAASSGITCNKAFESDFGKRILIKYGWKEGEGLGRQKTGRTDCIQARRREDKKGLGAEKRKADDNWDNWWSDCFNNVAKRIAVTNNVDAPRKGSDSEDDSEDDAQKAGGRVTAVKKAGVMGGKLRRVLRQEATPSPAQPRSTLPASP